MKKLLDMLTICLLGSAALLPALPAWADSPAPRSTAAPTETALRPDAQAEQAESVGR